MKIIIVVDSPFSERDYDRFGIARMLERSIIVELWDLRKIRDRVIDLEMFEKESIRLNVSKFDTYSQLEFRCGELKNSFVIDIRSEVNPKYSILWFKNQGARIVRLDQGSMPISLFNPTIKDLVIMYREKLLNLGIRGFFKMMIKRGVENLFGRRKVKYDVKVCGGAASGCDGAGLCIESHSLDYDVFLSVGGAGSLGDYIVFIDNGMTDHPDYRKLSVEPYCTSDKYYPSMNRLFDRIEAETGARIIISIHPRLTNLIELSNYYGNRKVVCGGTAEMVRDSKFVLAHDSTAVSFVILWGKPLLVVTTSQINRTTFTTIKALCALLGVDAVNADSMPHEFDWVAEAEKPKIKYSSYKEMLIKKSGTPEKNSWEIFLDEVSRSLPGCT